MSILLTQKFDNSLRFLERNAVIIINLEVLELTDVYAVVGLLRLLVGIAVRSRLLRRLIVVTAALLIAAAIVIVVVTLLSVTALLFRFKSELSFVNIHFSNIVLSAVFVIISS